MAANRLMMVDMLAYFDKACWFCDDPDFFIDVIQSLDGIYLKWSKSSKEKE